MEAPNQGRTTCTCRTLRSPVTEREVADLDVDVYPGPIPGEPGVLVLPGGGLREHTEHDGAGYAHWLNGIGYGAVVLRYRLRPDPFPLALQQARATLEAMQDSRLLPTADPHRIGVIGSSAGGLLAGLLATGAVLSIEPARPTPPRPAFHIQSYGLADLSLIPAEAVAALLGERAHWAGELSPVNHVDGLVPPTFVWTTAQDPPGLPNALAWAGVLAEHEVRFELHVYPEGWHGVGLADGVAWGAHGKLAIPHTAQWTTACERWLRKVTSEPLPAG